MGAWADSQGVKGSMINFLADARSELTQALGLVLDGVAPLGNPRCKRFAIVVDNAVVKAIAVSGDGVPDEDTFVEAMLKHC
mmetsp:Transcript_52404/g.113558  ORF Transcript_52404/g.113558 Transcript_52404/m.113558 type:complete len:81 (+) Transcript_52404:347-589(+)